MLGHIARYSLQTWGCKSTWTQWKLLLNCTIRIYALRFKRKVLCFSHDMPSLKTVIKSHNLIRNYKNNSWVVLCKWAVTLNCRWPNFMKAYCLSLFIWKSFYPCFDSISILKMTNILEHMPKTKMGFFEKCGMTDVISKSACYYLIRPKCSGLDPHGIKDHLFRYEPTWLLRFIHGS